MTFFERYWPTLVALPVMAAVGFWFWSERKSDQIVEELPSASTQEEGQAEQSDLEAGVDEELPTVMGRPGGPQVLEPIKDLSPRVEYRETLEFVPEQPGSAGKDYNQESPEVKKMLSQVSIELYGGSNCSECDAARSFMSANQLKFADYNTETNTNWAEKARRLSGSTALPVLVIDGQVLRGFSQSTFQTQLTSAVRSRIEK